MFGPVRRVVCAAALVASATALTADAAPVRVRSAAVDVRPTSVAAGPTVGSHVEIINAAAWHAAGIDGTGVTVGVIDFFDVDRYWNEAEHGPRPVPGVSAMCLDGGADCTDEFFDGVDAGGEDHGIAVVETVRDTAPGAQILIGQAVDVDDYRRLVDWFVDRGVDVISRSLGSRFDGPGDGRGPLNEVVDGAVERGVLWVNSAGNNGRDRYYRHPVRLRGTRVAFGPDGDETRLPFIGCVALGGVRWADDWDTAPADRTDYDVYIWESPATDPAGGSIVARSEARQHLGALPIENIGSTHCPSAGATLHLEIVWRGGDITGDVIEVLDYGSGMAAFTSAEGSAAVSVVDSANPGVVAVGAIDPALSGTVAAYSSRGPSNDGRALPDLTAPANVDSSVQGRFAGTSAAAAVVAGAAALVIDGGLAADPHALADLLRHLTIDRGEIGVDDAYGHGELRLPSPPATVDDTPSRFVGREVPIRVLDTRAVSVAGPPGPSGPLGRGDIIDLPMRGVNGVPAQDVTAVAVNIVAVDSMRPGHVQALPTNAARLGRFSNLNVDAPGQTRANFAIVPIGADGSISVHTLAGGHLVVDLLGWFEPATVPTGDGRFVELPVAERLLDTRRDSPAEPLASRSLRTVPLPMVADASQIAALVVTVTAAEPTSPGWLQVLPAGRPDVIGSTSTVNISSRGGAVANTAIVPVTHDGIAVTGFFADGGSSHVVVDAIGYITSSAADPADAGRYVPVTPDRAHDSRLDGRSVGDGDAVVVDATSTVGVPVSAAAVVWNATIVAATRAGYLRAWGAEGAEPSTSSLNWTHVGEVRAAAVIAPVDGGRSRFATDDGDVDLTDPLGDLVVDVFGYFTS